MDFLNVYGLMFLLLLLLPNILFMKNFEGGRKRQTAFENAMEQIGRYGSMLLMVFNTGVLEFDEGFDRLVPVYLIVNTVFIALYWAGWVRFNSKRTVLRAMWLAAVPSAVFLFCGIISLHILQIIFAAIFAVFHCVVSYKNSKQK